MKYAIIVRQNRIARIVEREVPPIRPHIEVTDEQITLIESLDIPTVIDGEIVSLTELKSIHKEKFRFDESVGEWVIDPITTEEFNTAKAEKIKELEAARYDAEISGTTVAELGNATVLTDKETQSELGKALAVLTINPTLEINWKFPDGSIILLDKTAIEAVAQSVFNHVQQTRDDYKTKVEAVSAATTQEELTSIVW